MGGGGGSLGRMRFARTLSVVALAFAGACGSETAPPASVLVSAPRDGGAAGPTFGAPKGTHPNECSTRDRDTGCVCEDVALFDDPPNVYFVLDRSMSMSVDGRWDQVRVVVGQMLRDLGPRARFGAAVFPGDEGECAPGSEIMSLRRGDAPAVSIDGPTTSFLLAATRPRPRGGTPTAATLRALEKPLLAAPGKTFVVLATDGGPNCNVAASCGVDACIPNIEAISGCPPQGPNNCCAAPEYSPGNCLDLEATTREVRELAEAGIATFVLGVPGSETYASALADLAKAGGTALEEAPFYYRADVSGEAPLRRALRKIAAKIVASCTFKLKREPENPSRLNVYLDNEVLRRDGDDGWDREGLEVTLRRGSCARVKSGDVLSVRIIEGCPTVVR